MRRNKLFFICLIIAQLFFIFFIAFKLYKIYTTPRISIAPIEKNTIHISPTDKLKYFFEPKPNMVITEPYYKQVGLSTPPVYTINHDTLHDRFDYPEKKDKKTFRIITLGDSFTYGLYVNTKDNWTEVLETLLSSCSSDMHFEVINLAVSNYDIQYSIERLKKRGIKYNPDLVIWFLKYDDFTQINEITLPLKRQYYKEMNINEGSDKNTENGKFWPYAEKVMQAFEEKYSQDQILSKQQEFLQSIHTFYTGNLLTVLFGMEPYRHKEVIETFVKQRKNTFVYTQLPEVSRLPDRHPSTKGHKEIAENIFKHMIDKKIVPCN